MNDKRVASPVPDRVLYLYLRDFQPQRKWIKEYLEEKIPRFVDSSEQEPLIQFSR